MQHISNAYVPKKNPLMTTVPTVNKLNVVNIWLSADDLRTPQATTTENWHNMTLLNR